jgi:hypothetical protein
MSDQSEIRWRSMAKWLRNVGGVCCVGFFLSLLALAEVYYPSYRPEVPQSERGWTTGLTWTHPVRYGTPQDESRSQRLFNLFFLGSGLIISGELIKIYKLGDYSGFRPAQTHLGITGGDHGSLSECKIARVWE